MDMETIRRRRSDTGTSTGRGKTRGHVAQDDPRSWTSDDRWRMLLGVVLAISAAVLCAALLPRGPITTLEALLAMGAAALVGTGAGIVTRRRIAVLLVPAVFVAALEIVQLGLVGPTVDRPRFTMVGLLAWAAVRLVLGLLLVAPMAVGVGWGVQFASRRRRERSAFRRPGSALLVVATLGLAGLSLLIALPASTPPILGPDGEPLSGSIAELTTVAIDGQDQALSIRGVDIEAPVLLHLAGGPGGTDIGAMRLDTGLEQHFVVVTWDQRGTGKSYRAIDPVSTLTLDGAVEDTIAVTDYLRERFDENRIVITGQSYGTIPAVLAVARHPERYRAVVTTGQMVDVVETDQIFYDDITAEARRRDAPAIEERLAALGRPPYARWEDDLALADLERSMFTYPEFDGHTEMTATIWGPENSLMDSIAAVRGLLDSYALLYPQLQDLDLREQVRQLDVPVYMVMGEHESRGRTAPARTWYDQLVAPSKQWIELPASGHRASFEQPALYTELLARVLAETDRG